MNRRNSKSDRNTFIDLFAGCGGLSLGLKWAGFRPLLAVEEDKWAAESYAANFPEAHVVCEDIREYDESQIHKVCPERPMLICGGPPCQGFSQSNIVNRDPKDPRNSLFSDFIRWVQVLRPKACLIENVRGLLTARTTTGTRVVKLIKEELDNVGYVASARLLDAQHFGVPQRRERVFIIATLKEEGPQPHQLFPEPTHSTSHEVSANLFRGDPIPVVTLWDAISDLPQCVWQDYDSNASYESAPANDFQTKMREGASGPIRNHEPMKHTARIVERFKHIAYGQSEENSPEEHGPRQRGAPERKSNKRYGQNSRRQPPDIPCNTIVASSHTNYIHPFLNRNFTVREMMRIQSFPDLYRLCGKRAVLSRKLSERKGLTHELFLDQRMQVGNAVPPILAAAIARRIAEMI